MEDRRYCYQLKYEQYAPYTLELKAVELSRMKKNKKPQKTKFTKHKTLRKGFDVVAIGRPTEDIVLSGDIFK